MAADLAGTPDSGLTRAALRRRPPDELRPLRSRPSGASSSTSTTSTRPCRGRGSGTSSAWPPASRWPAGPRLRRRDPARDRARRVRKPIARRCTRWPRCGPSTSGTRASTSRPDPRRRVTALRRKDARRFGQGPVRGRQAKDDLRALLPAHARGRRRAAPAQRPAAARARRRSCSATTSASSTRTPSRTRCAGYRVEPAARPPARSSTSTGSATSPARSSASAASARAPGCCCSPAATPTTRCSCRPSRRRRRCSSASSAAAATGTPAAASSRASG